MIGIILTSLMIVVSIVFLLFSTIGFLKDIKFLKYLWIATLTLNILCLVTEILLTNLK